MDTDIKEMFQIIINKIDAQDKQFKSIESQFKAIENQISDVKLTIENDVTQRIEALFDGYKLTHEKQWELERRVEAIERKLDIA